MNNDPMETKPTSPPKKNFLILIILLLIFVLAGGFGIYWYFSNSTKKVTDNNPASSALKAYSLKGDHQTISFQTPSAIEELKLKDPQMYQEAKKMFTITDDKEWLFLVDYSKTEKFLLRQGKTSYFTVLQEFTKGATPQERQDNMMDIYQKVNEKSQIKDLYEKITINNYPVIKHSFTKNDSSAANIVEYLIFAKDDTFNIIRSFSNDFSPQEEEADFQQILLTVTITNN